MKSFLKLAGGLGLLGALLLLERRRPLRVEKESKLRRVQRNLAVAALSAITIHFVESLVITPLAEMVKKKRWGLLKQRRLPRIVDTLAALAILDYTLYLQHVLHHRVPLLWRFHAVHHVDLDLDTSTALRFHFGEIALSIPYRIAQVLLIGVDPRLVNRLANLFVAVDCVLSLQFAAAHLHRRSLGSGHRDATHAWYSSFK